MYPKQVDINEKELERLTATFQTAYKDIVGEITTATNFGVANRKVILAQVETILQDLGSEIDQTVKEQITKAYTTGAAEAVAQLKNVGADVPITAGFNRVHKDAIEALVSDAAKSFGDSITGVGRSADLLLGKATRQMLTQKIATGMVSGEALKQVKTEIKGVLQEQGLDALKDKAGRSWTLDRYAETLYRTKVAEARNRGLMNRTAENGYDLVQVSAHGATDECGQWEGQILSINGDTPGYPTLADAEAGGLFHPNCRHAINVLAPSLAKETQAYDTETGDYGAKGASISK